MEETQAEGTSAEIRDPEAVLAALDRAKKDAKESRLEKERLEQELQKQSDELVKYSGKLLREKIEKELSKLNISNSDRVLKYLNTANLTFDDDFNIIGLDDQIKEMKKDFPELFDPKLLVGGKADAGATQSVEKKVSTSELLAKIAMGR